MSIGNNQKPKRIIGIDPGISGGVAIIYQLNDGPVIDVFDLPYHNKVIDLEKSTFIIGPITTNDIVVVERPQWRPNHGSKQVITTWYNYGRLSSLFDSWHEVSASKWKKNLDLSSNKDQSRQMAAELYPSIADRLKRKKDDGRAEALLIAHWGLHHLSEIEQIL